MKEKDLLNSNLDNTFTHDESFNNDNKNPNKKKKVNHRVLVFSCVGVVTVGLLGGVFLTRYIKAKKSQVNPLILKLTDFKDVYTKYQYFKEYYPNDDPLKYYTIAEMASIAMSNTLYQGDYNNVTNKEVLAVGYGTNVTDAIFFDVTSNISNCFIKQADGKAMEESITYGDQLVAPRVSKRDVLTPGDKDGKVDAYDGEATSSSTTQWNTSITRTFKENKEQQDYSEEVGKDPSNPFLYTISNDTVLTDKVYDEINGEKHYGSSSITKSSDGGYDIHLDIHNELGIARYMKRIHYMSNKDANHFDYVKLDFHTDKNLVIQSSKVHELYYMTSENLRSEGNLETKFYYGNQVKSIPDVTTGESFDYSKYPN